MANVQDFIARITEDINLLDKVKDILLEKGLNTDAVEKKLEEFAAKLGFKLSGDRSQIGDIVRILSVRYGLAVIFALFTIGVVYEYFKKPMGFRTFERWCIAAVYGGGLGNMIDRVRLGYVVDMLETKFMVFPVFNVADCFITCGCILMMISLIFFNKEFWKDEKK